MPADAASANGMPSEDHMAWLAPLCDCGHFHQDHSRYGCLHCKCAEDFYEKCDSCNGSGRKPYERSQDGWPISWVSCRSCNGQGLRRPARASNGASGDSR